MHPIDLIEAVEDMVEVCLGDALSVVLHREGQGLVIATATEEDLSVLGSVFEGVRQQVEEDTLNLLRIQGQGVALIHRKLDRELHAALAGEGLEGLCPLLDQWCQRNLPQVQIQFTMLIFLEIQDLIDQPLQDADVLRGDAQQGLLLDREVVRLGQLLHWLGYQGERRAQVVRDVGEEGQLRLGSLVQLLVQRLLLVSLLLQQFVLRQQLLLVSFTFPVGVQQEEEDA